MNNVSQTMLPELDQEMTPARRVLERVPEGPKSMMIGRLADEPLF